MDIGERWSFATCLVCQRPCLCLARPAMFMTLRISAVERGFEMTSYLAASGELRLWQPAVHEGDPCASAGVELAAQPTFRLDVQRRGIARDHHRVDPSPRRCERAVPNSPKGARLVATFKSHQHPAPGEPLKAHLLGLSSLRRHAAHV